MNITTTSRQGGALAARSPSVVLVLLVVLCLSVLAFGIGVLHRPDFHFSTQVFAPLIDAVMSVLFGATR